jgi:hypothetical protein
MTRNVSNLDRGLRAFLVAPVALVAAVLVGAGSFGGILLLALAGVMLATSAVGFCPLYTLLHINTGGRRPLPH